MNRKINIAVTLLGSSLAFAQLSAVDKTAEAARPNVIIFYTDDHGWADLSIQGVFDDVKTPHTDKLAQSGVRFTSGYCSAPQCRPSRAGLMSGRNQSKFGLEHNGHNGYPWSEYTIAERLRDAGYMTGMVGKWHLNGNVDSTGKLPDGSQASTAVIAAGLRNAKPTPGEFPGQVHQHGFTEHFSGSMNAYYATHTATGEKLDQVKMHPDRRYRIDVQAEWSASFIERHAKTDQPFFLYVPFFAPHVPLEAPEKYLSRFPGEMPERRRLALAMISSVDDGVGLVTKTLEEQGIRDNTLIFYIADNGAPLKITKKDAPGGGPGWDGSLNDPWIGEKGMLTEGGIRVPFIASWPNKLPANQVSDKPVISFDAIATSLVAAGLDLDERIDGVNIVPYLDGTQKGSPHDALYWRWAGQSAIREGDWKFLHAEGRAYLFNLSSKEHETKNLIRQNPERAERLKKKLEAWANELYEPGINQPFTYAGPKYFDYYLDGKTPTPPRSKKKK